MGYCVLFVVCSELEQKLINEFEKETPDVRLPMFYVEEKRSKVLLNIRLKQH